MQDDFKPENVAKSILELLSTSGAEMCKNKLLEVCKMLQGSEGEVSAKGEPGSSEKHVSAQQRVAQLVSEIVQDKANI